MSQMAGVRSIGGRGFAAGLIVFAGIFVVSGFLHFFSIPLPTCASCLRCCAGR